MRFEYKYLLQKNLEDDINSFCSKHGYLDSYCFNDLGYEIRSVYKYYWRSQKEHGKIRLRKYTTSENVYYYIEEKVKKHGFVTKARLQIEEQVYNNLCTCENEEMFFLLLNDLNFYSKNTDYSSGKFNTYTVQYYRIPWKIKYLEKEYRLTIDKDLFTDNGDESIRILDEEKLIFEIKGAKEIKDTEILSNYIEQEYQLTPVKISKYKLAKKKSMELNLGEPNFI
ncbi:VTC domain-containing protein [Bacillus toyonensis]|uniref:VTC domain-containing protein n=1 Tax=Bacillus toyonensis TaxID=155322 RepID=UPI0021761A42|nr:VTC domain-containing protein [Bacillus toyonensis]